MHKRATAVLAAAMTMVLGSGVVLAADQFPDVPDTHTFRSDIGWLADNGITFGYSNGNFGPEDSVTRGQMAAFLHRFYSKLAAGPAGPAGQAGNTGPAGPAGPQGETGETGAAGPAGETGPAGPQGETGETGALPVAGLPGRDGRDGCCRSSGRDGRDGCCRSGR